MSELSRFAASVARCIAAARPSALYQPVQVDELRFQIAPYRLVRGKLGLASIEEYELLLLRLLAGVEGLAQVRPLEAGELCRNELAALVADLSVLDRIGDAQILVAWSAAVGSGLDESVGEGVGVDAAPAPVAQDESEVEPRRLESLDEVTAPAELQQEPELEPTASSGEGKPPGADEFEGAEVGGGVPSQPESIERRRESAAVTAATDPGLDSAASRCTNCGCRIPRGRPVRFCPACGANVVPLRCTRCNGELEPTWRHCVLCGQTVINESWFA